MSESDQNHQHWDLITRRIEEGKCIVILGPDIVTQDEASLNVQLEAYLKENCQHLTGDLKYYTDDEFFWFQKKIEKEYAFMYIQKFYADLQPNDMHRQIVDIPFHLIISVSPDLLIKKVFDGTKHDYIFDFYTKEEAPKGFEKPTAEKPLVYNLFGNVESEASLVLTYEDLFEYLITIFSEHQLHQDLKLELKAARLILFLGFKFDKWYFKLILRLLELHTDKLNYAGLKDWEDSPHVINFYHNEFEYEFLNYNSHEILGAIHKKCKEKGILRVAGQKSGASEPEVFISYAWGGESEQVADKVCEALSQRGYQVVRDKKDLKYKGNINELMRKIGRGKFVVVIISDKYLKSESCMYEMLEIKDNGELYDRIFPIVLNDAKIFEVLDRIDYKNYWDEKVEVLRKKIKEISDPVGTVGYVEKMSQYADIMRIIDGITAMLNEMNTQTLEMHQVNNFETLIKAIEEKQHEESGD